jgi:hypothetical protein
VYGNADRTAINAGIFSNVLKAHCKASASDPSHMLVVKAGDMVRTTKSGGKHPMGEDDKEHVYENCGDHKLRAKVFGRNAHFVDPMLKLHCRIPLMLVTNDDVPNGHANGTRVLLEGVVLKDGITTEIMLVDGIRCPSVDASNVNHFVCSSQANSDKLFLIQPKAMACAAKAPIPSHIGGTVQATINFNVTLTQLPVLVNNATTGHKLQGQTKKDLVVAVWSKRRNWNYVALSRVATRDGLYLVKPLPYDTDFSIPHDLRQMLNTLQRTQPEEIVWDLEEEETILEGRRRGSTHAGTRN